MRLENSELRAFRAVVEEGGFRRAADALHISQSAVSQAVAGLEGKLNTSLVTRGKELKLTDAGKRIFEHAVDVLRDEQETLEYIAQLRYGKVETLDLALSASINRFYAPELVSTYCRENPRTGMKIAEMRPAASFTRYCRAMSSWGWAPSRKIWPRLNPSRSTAIPDTWW